jgi:hypothetical protein
MLHESRRTSAILRVSQIEVAASGSAPPRPDVSLLIWKAATGMPRQQAPLPSEIHVHLRLGKYLQDMLSPKNACR